MDFKFVTYKKHISPYIPESRCSRQFGLLQHAYT